MEFLFLAKSRHSPPPRMPQIGTSDVYGEDAVLLAVQRWYDFPEFGVIWEMPLKMKPVVKFLLAAVILNGCVAPSIKPSPDQIADIQKIAIVAIESPPLSAPGLSYSAGQSRRPMSGTVLVSSPLLPFRARGAAMIAVYGILMLVEGGAFDAGSSQPAIPLDEALSRSDAWMPTVGLAGETANQLRAGWGAGVEVVDGYLALPRIVDRNRTLLMENWLAPIRAWYNENETSFGYVALPNKDTDAVVEVGIANYEMVWGGLLIQVMSKLVDPATRRVLGRSRNGSLVEAPPMDELFGSEGKIYKEFFAQATRSLIAANLKELGLLP